MKKSKRKTICNIIIIFFLGVCVGIHRNVIKAIITGSEMPEAPEWHCWCRR